MSESAPTLTFEATLWQQDFTRVAGVDEAGRGCLAGPVVAAAVVLNRDRPIHGLQDSKLLDAATRDELAETIRKKALAVGIGRCSPQEIDDANILLAALKAMAKAVDACSPSPDYLLIDGNKAPATIEYPFDTIIKGDMRSQSIAAASIIAKTHRDNLMHELHEKHPHYGWNTNVGYPTAAHYDGLKEHGPTAFHRHSFRLTTSS